MRGPFKGKVLRLFGMVIRPANWVIFLAGIALGWSAAPHAPLSPPTVNPLPRMGRAEVA